MWINPATFASGYQVIFANDTSGGLSCLINSTGTLSYGRALIAVDGTTTGTVTFNQWNHIAFVRSGTSTSQFVVYINGSAAGSFTNSTSYAAGVVRIGTDGGGSSFPYTGYISNLRVISGTAVYTGAFTPPTLAPISTTGPTSAASYSSTTNVNTTFLTPASLLLNMANAGIYDAAVQNNVTTVSNAQASSTPTAQWPPTSMKFNGSTDYLTSLFSPSLSFGSSNFTIEAWIYFSTLPSNTWYTIYSYGNTNGLPRFILYFDTRTSQSSPGLRFTIVNSGGTAILDFNGGGTSGWNSGVWYYVAITRNANTWTLYRNGTSIGTTNNSSAVPAVTNGGSYIGVEPSGVAFFNGSIQDLRITNGVARTITASPTAAFPTR
jgi:hypothetical protein